jgi:CRP/FNR family cyclic AMP-dependent transcriptional regulator
MPASAMPSTDAFGTLRSLTPGMLLVRQFDPSGPMYLILSGVVRVLRMTPSAPPHELARLGEGDHVGEIGALLDVPRSASVEAVTDVQAIELSPEQARMLAVQYPSFGRTLAESLNSRAGCPSY